VADLGAAIWLGLPQDDKLKALVNRGLAYKAAGLGKEAEAELAAARSLGGSSEVNALIADGGGAPPSAASIAAFDTQVTPGDTGASSSSSRPRAEPIPDFSTSVSGGAPQPSEPPPTRTADASPSAWSTSVSDDSKPAPRATGGNLVSRWWGSLSDSSVSNEAPAPAPAPAAPPPKPAPPPAAAASSSWSTSTETQDAAPSGTGESGSRFSRWFGRTAAVDSAAQPAPAAAPSAGGDYRLQLATSRSEAEAQALWKQVSQSQGLGGVGHNIERVEIGSFGTFYALRVGPFPDKAESLKVCNALKRSGIDCSLAEQ
jgi:hypothetical protein